MTQLTQARYDAIADWYDEQVREGGALQPAHALVIPVLLDLLGDVRGHEVCDLACGQGIVAREMARRGARVTGVDISERLLAIARREESAEPLGIVYIHDDARTLATIADAAFDAVACNMALIDIPDLADTVAAVRRVLRSGGTFAFSLPHPCIVPPGSRFATDEDGTPARLVRGYFDEGYSVPPHAPGVRGRVGTHHRTLATYLNTLTEAGFTLERVAEPRPVGPIPERMPAAFAEAPGMFIISWRKA